jgi:16S rRNA (cytidine1402-2'-O)-methyltransferase
MEPGLYIVGTPIGNLQDITLRALDTLKGADLVLAEDTRVSRVLLDRHGIATRMLSYHKYNEQERLPEVIARLQRGEKIALVTDAGMPGVSDPGARVVTACREAGLPVFVIPGPSSVTAAVALSGMASGGFLFAGFLPHKSGARKRRLAEVGTSDLPLVLFESPYRLMKLMGEIEEVLGARRLFVARELTKHFEEGLAGTPAEIRASFGKRTVKGEVVVVIEPGEKKRKSPPEEAGPDEAGGEGESDDNWSGTEND